MCETCPFSNTEEAERLINYGCLPMQWKILRLKQEYNLNWGCHYNKENETKLCSGFVRYCKENNINHKEGNYISYEDWYYG